MLAKAAEVAARRLNARVPKAQASDAMGNVEYLRHVYASTREWYVTAERKAQLLLTANGALVTIVFGALIGRTGAAHVNARFGLAGMIFFGTSGASVVGAIACAALSLWSLHGRGGAELKQLGVDPENGDTYRPEALWYFGHLALLRRDVAVDKLLLFSQEDEARALAFNLVDLARKVARKHRWINVGWTLTALGLIALAGAVPSILGYV